MMVSISSTFSEESKSSTQRHCPVKVSDLKSTPLEKF
jgi:hypothetical protein